MPAPIIIIALQLCYLFIDIFVYVFEFFVGGVICFVVFICPIAIAYR